MTELSAETDTNERRDVNALASHSARITRRIQTIEKKPLYNKQYNKCGFRVNVETFGNFKYICAGLKMQCNLVPHLSYCRPLAAQRSKLWLTDKVAKI
jgi:hypothetical protein